MEVPSAWVWISGAYFLFATLTHIALIVLVVKLIEIVKGLQPQIKALGDRVEGISQKVDDVATSVKDTVELVGARTRTIADKAQVLADETEKRTSGIATALAVVSSAVKIFNLFKEMRHREPLDSQPATRS